jgi:alanine-glyoxylate transaminase/serine-glyoxylate transaminase/serine-pyruvate transaminase
MLRRGRIFLATPGPTNVPDRVLRAMHRAAEDFAAPAFSDVARSCLEDLAKVFGTRGEVFCFIGNGHAAWEVPLVNLLDPGEAVLLPVSGRFSQSWAEMAEKLELDTRRLDMDRRLPLDPAMVEAALRADTARRIKAVMVVQTETATGITSDLVAIRNAIDAAAHPALLVVDAIASLAAEPFAMDDWGVDCALTASQKGLMLPPGLCFVAMNERALKIVETCRHPRRYFDIGFRRGSQTYQWFHGTPPLQHIWGLRESLDMLFEEGLEAVVARHRRLADAVRACIARWSEAGALAFHASEPASRSNAVTTIRVATGIDPDAMRRLARDCYQTALGSGLGDLEGKAFRIGHLGDLNEPMILGTLATTELALRRSAIPFGDGGLAAAVESLALDDAGVGVVGATPASPLPGITSS